MLKVGKVVLVEFQLKWMLHPKPITGKDLKVLAYVFLYKGKAIEKMLEDGVSKSKKSLENTISTYRKLGVIQGFQEKTILNPALNALTQDLSYTINFKLDDTLD